MQELLAVKRARRPCTIEGMSMGQRIKSRRECLGMTQTELGESVGVSYQSVQQWEDDETKPKRMRMEKLALALKKSISWVEFGASSSKRGKVIHAFKINEKTLAKCILKFEKRLAERKIDLDQVKIAEYANALCLLYEEHMEKGQIDTHTVDNVIKFRRLG